MLLLCTQTVGMTPSGTDFLVLSYLLTGRQHSQGSSLPGAGRVLRLMHSKLHLCALLKENS